MADDYAFREAAITWLRVRMLRQAVFTREELASANILGTPTRLVGTQTGIWKPRQLDAALSILTGYYPDDARRPYADGFASDGLLRTPTSAPTSALTSAPPATTTTTSTTAPATTTTTTVPATTTTTSTTTTTTTTSTTTTTTTPPCTPYGQPCDFFNPGACCSLTCMASAGGPVCA